MNYNFKNMADGNADLYIYGAIADTKWDDTDVDLKDFKEAIDGVSGHLNIYINSVGGSVFTASAMASIIQRLEAKGVKVTAYIDGLCASASTFLAMVADEIKVYNNSIMMIHKPMGAIFGNATEMKKMIATLDTIEESMLNLYENKAKIDREKIKNLVDRESWLEANEIDEYFNVTRLNSNKQISACADLDKCGYTIPDNIVAKLQAEETAEAVSKIENLEKVENEEIKEADYSEFDEILNTIKGASQNE